MEKKKRNIEPAYCGTYKINKRRFRRKTTARKKLAVKQTGGVYEYHYSWLKNSVSEFILLQIFLTYFLEELKADNNNLKKEETDDDYGVYIYDNCGRNRDYIKYERNIYKVNVNQDRLKIIVETALNKYKDKINKDSNKNKNKFFDMKRKILKNSIDSIKIIPSVPSHQHRLSPDDVFKCILYTSNYQSTFYPYCGESGNKVIELPGQKYEIPIIDTLKSIAIEINRIYIEEYEKRNKEERVVNLGKRYDGIYIERIRKYIESIKSPKPRDLKILKKVLELREIEKKEYDSTPEYKFIFEGFTIIIKPNEQEQEQKPNVIFFSNTYPEFQINRYEKDMNSIKDYDKEIKLDINNLSKETVQVDPEPEPEPESPLAYNPEPEAETEFPPEYDTNSGYLNILTDEKEERNNFGYIEVNDENEDDEEDHTGGRKKSNKKTTRKRVRKNRHKRKTYRKK